MKGLVVTNDTSNNQRYSTELTELDASEFGNHVRQGGWRLGLLVARNVEKGAGQGSRSDIASEPRENSRKVSAREFAEKAGVSDFKVRHYLKAWNLAAEQGYVPSSSDLTPGADIDLDVDQLPTWSDFYEAKNKRTEEPPAPIAPSVEQVTEAVRSNPEYAKAVAEYVEPSREQVTKAMRSNPEIEKAVREEAWDITREKARSQSTTWNENARSDQDTPKSRTNSDERGDVVTLAMKIRSARIALDDAIEIANRIQGANINGLTDSIRERCDLLDATLQTESFDSQLTALLESEAGR